MDSELTLTKAIQKVGQRETMKQQQVILLNSDAEDKIANVDA